MDNKIDIERELERINKDIDDMQAAGKKQTILDFFGGSDTENALVRGADHQAIRRILQRERRVRTQ